MCVSDKIACSGVVLACILNGIIAILVSNQTITFSGHTENKLFESSQNLCEDFYQGYFPNRGECYKDNVHEDKEIVACIGGTSYGATRCEKFQWWTKNTERNKASDYCQEKHGTSEFFVFPSELVRKFSLFCLKNKELQNFCFSKSGKMKQEQKSDLVNSFICNYDLLLFQEKRLFPVHYFDWD